MTSSTFNVNDNLVRLDNLIRGIEFLSEELTTRRSQIMEEVSPEKVKELTLDTMSSHAFGELLVSKIRENFGDEFYREVAFVVMGQIDNDIDAFITDRVHTALRNAGVNVPEVAVEAAA